MVPIGGTEHRKITIVPFTRKKKISSIRDMHFLGTTPDKILLWSNHIQVITNKATTALMICRNLVDVKK